LADVRSEATSGAAGGGKDQPLAGREPPKTTGMPHEQCPPNDDFHGAGLDPLHLL
jgi:hypothetical protein